LRQDNYLDESILTAMLDFIIDLIFWDLKICICAIPLL